MENIFISGFSKLSKEEKIKLFASFFSDSKEVVEELKSYWHPDPAIQKLFEEFAENTISNYHLPYGIAPNFLIDGKTYMIPMVIEESSVIAAASNSARFWYNKGGFHTEIISTVKVGQVHFLWDGNPSQLEAHMPALKKRFLSGTASITANMRKRGGGILDLQLRNLTNALPNYYQLFATFETVDSMGANFINSCLEEFAAILKDYCSENTELAKYPCKVIMSILSNYTPECRVKCWVQCSINDLNDLDTGIKPDEFARKFETSVRISQTDVYRATTHNKGIFNGIDAVALATGNDFRAIEACGHTWAARSGNYTGLSDVKVTDNTFYYELHIAMAMGTVGGLTQLHPLAKRSLQLLGNPSAKELIKIAAVAGIANNFGAVKALTTKGIQLGHMKMHLLNILNTLNADEQEKQLAVEFFKNHKVSYNAVQELLKSYRNS